MEAWSSRLKVAACHCADIPPSDFSRTLAHGRTSEKVHAAS
ncbi:MAG: hypothetical protein OJF61_001418 [Rhodanobacteraceae bacterium]|nr:MAG: hypothetical protein OJF61_001418 [Rhodanobacteraceae bacterium]